MLKLKSQIYRFDIDYPKTPQLTPRGFALLQIQLKKSLSLHKHPLEQPLHRRQGGDDDAKDRIHADGEEIVDQRIHPRVAKPVFRRIRGEKHGSRNRACDHARKAADRRTQREILRKEARQPQARKRHKVVEDELHGMHEVRALNHL